MNVAAVLTKQKKSVILAELRPSFGTLAYQMRLEPRESLRTLLDDPAETLDQDDVTVRLSKGPGNSRVLFGPQLTDGYKKIDPVRADAVVKLMAEMAEFVILDLPSQPSPATQAAIGLCHLTVVVTERELSSVLCGKAAINQLQSWGVSGSAVSAIVVSRSEQPKPLDLRVIRASLECEIVGVVPLACSAHLETAINRADGVAASFLEIGNRLAADKLVGVKC